MSQTVRRVGGTKQFTIRPRILVADEHSRMREYLTRLLSQQFEIDTAADPATALHLARERAPDIVVANVMMQTTGHMDLLREFRRDPWERMPIILYSTNGDQNPGVNTLKPGANVDVIAPFSEQRLLALVRAYQGATQLRRESIRSLRLTEDRFRTLKTMLTPGVWLADPNGEIIGELAWWWEQLTGQTPDQYTGFGWQDAVHPADKPRAFKGWQDALHNKKAFEIEFRVRRSNGTYAYVRCQGAPVTDGEGHIRGWIGTMMNIDDQKRAEEALRYSEERHRTFVTMTALAVWTAGPNGDVVSTAVGWTELTGQTLDQYRGTGWLDVVHPDDKPRLLEMWHRAMRDGTPIDAEYRVRRKNGEYGYVRDQGVPLRNLDGSVREWIGAVTDIDSGRKAQEALRASEEHYRTLITATGAAVWNATANGELVGECPGWESLTGQTPEQYRGWGWLDLVHPDDKERTTEAWQRALGEATPTVIDYKARRRDGSYGYVRAHGAPVHNPDGSVREWIGTFTDIDDQKRVEEALRASEDELLANFELAGIGQVQTDPKTGRYVRVNNRFCEMVGYSADELLTMTYMDITHPDDRAAAMCAHLGLLRSETGRFSTDKRYIRKDGSILWVLVTSTLIHDTHRRPLRTITMIEDVTERRQSEALSLCQKRALELVAQGASLSEVLDNVILDVEKQATVELRASIQVLDEEGKGLRLCAAPSLPESFREMMTSCPLTSRRVAPKAPAVFLEGPLIISDLAQVPEWADIANVLTPYAIRSIWSAPIISSDKRPLGVFCFYSPRLRTPSAAEQLMLEKVTGTIALAIERKQAESERERLLVREKAAREQAEVASRVKDEFLAVVSHELRTPLNAINGWTHMLLRGSLDAPSQLRALESIKRQVRSQSQLIDDLLDVARIVSGKLRLELREVDPSKVIAAALDVVRPAAEAKQIELLVELDPTASALNADPERLQQVIWNLLSNAIKFTPAGGRVEIRARRTDSSIEIVVVDTGQGISEDFLPYVFDRFRQADVSTTRKHGGIGLGLAIVRHLVELHGGTVFAASAGKGKGAAFTIRLPVRAVRTSRSVVAGRKHEPDAPQDISAEDRESLKELKVLVVEDSAEDREVLCAELTYLGATVSASSGAAEALIEMDHVHPDVLVADIGMAGEDGYSLIRKIRASDPDHGGLTPAIALTAYAGEANQKRALEAGYQKHMTKPADPNELARTIVRLARGSQSGLFK